MSAGTILLFRDDIARLQQCAVYLAFTDGVCVYVGASTNGVARPLHLGHHRLKAIAGQFDLLAIPVNDTGTMYTLENVLIAAIKPRLNNPTRYFRRLRDVVALLEFEAGLPASGWGAMGAGR